ncbi:hypothetical protein DL95DRAFT_484672 [Leptodontidium sp. 2 PMI_412]|nr:hypothetical protein DL95DRAFT_484672 [Leptodontidium sp. 2 PMI_412]
MAFKRSRPPSDSDNEDLERHSNKRTTKQVRFGGCFNVPNRVHQLNSMSGIANEYDATDGIPLMSSASQATQATGLPRRRFLKKRARPQRGSPLRSSMGFTSSSSSSSSSSSPLGASSSASSTATPSLRDFILDSDIDTGVDADTEDCASSSTSETSSNSQSLGAAFLVSGYEKPGSTPTYSRLLQSSPSVIYQRRLYSIERQIKTQINRNSQVCISVNVEASSVLSKSEQKRIKERHGIEGGFMLVFTGSKRERERAMARLVEEGLYFGAPELKVQAFIEDSEEIMADGHEQEKSSGPVRDTTTYMEIECHTMSGTFQITLPIRLKSGPPNSAGGEYYLDGTKRPTPVGLLPEDTLMS